MYKIFIFIYLLFLSHTVQAQTITVDSLKAELSKASGSERIPVLLELAKESRQIDSMASVQFAEAALELMETYKDTGYELEAFYQAGWAYVYLQEFETALRYADRIESETIIQDHVDALAKAYLLKGRIYRQKEDYKTSHSNLESALELSRNSSDRLLRISILNEVGSVYRRQGNNSSALSLHSEALKIGRELDDKFSISTTLIYLGIIHDILGNYDEALRIYHEAIARLRALNDSHGVAAALNNIGILHQRIKNYDEAFRFYSEAHEQFKALDRKLDYATTYNNMGEIHSLQTNYEKALENYRQALRIWQEFNKTESISLVLSNIGVAKMQQGYYEEALNYHRQSLEIRKSLGDQLGSATSLIEIAGLQANLDQPDFAMAAAREGLTLAEKTGSWPVISDAHLRLSELYERSGKHHLALNHFRKYKTASDSLFNIDSQNVLTELQEQYKTMEQQQQIAALKQREKIKNLWFGILAGGALLLGIVIVLVYSRFILKKQAHMALEDLYEKEIEKANLEAEKSATYTKYLHTENERKSQELSAARDLQLSMLPSKIPEIPNATVSALMKTATEVGGDYYDFHIAVDGTSTIVIGDATGHGLKAGTVVTATKGLFNLLAGKYKLSRILQLCSKAIKGMNLPRLYMALALIRLRGNTLRLAGAGMPPALIYRADTKQVDVVPLKGMPLGSYVNYPYTETVLTLNKDDVVLLYTDGLPELFNPNREMLGYQKIPQLLAEAGDKSLDKIIDHIRDTANKWLDGGELKDDITFLLLKSTVNQEEPVLFA